MDLENSRGDYSAIQHRQELQAPFQAEMLTVWLIRWFAIIVNHIAKCAGAEQAVELDPKLAKRLGVGNSTGLGMAPFLVRHPDLVNAWITTRETALVRVRSLNAYDQETKTGFLSALAEAISSTLWNTSHPLQVTRLADLRNDLSLLDTYVRTFDWDTKLHGIVCGAGGKSICRTKGKRYFPFLRAAWQHH